MFLLFLLYHYIFFNTKCHITDIFKKMSVYLDSCSRWDAFCNNFHYGSQYANNDNTQDKEGFWLFLEE